MHRSVTTTAIAGAAAMAAGVLLGAQQAPSSSQPQVETHGQVPSQFPLSHAIRERGSSVTGAYEGWYNDADGSIRLLVGYFNRNTKQELDIPVGPNNRVDPGGPDQGQPTHFLTGRQWGVFTIKVPKDFGGKQLVWTLVANGFTNTITLHARPEWFVAPLEDPGSGNTPPVLKFAADGPSFTGPPLGIATRFTAKVGEPLPLTVWATDKGPRVNDEEEPAPRPRRRAGAAAADRPAFTPPPPLQIIWSMSRGPAGVTFDKAKTGFEKADGGQATTTASFSAPGDYILRLQANDRTGEGGGGFQCCWSNVLVGVTVKPATNTR